MNLNTIAEELFAKIRGRFPGVTIGDEEGNVTTEPTEARYFEFPFKEKNGDAADKASDKISISLDEESGVTIMYNDSVAEDEMSKNNWYKFLREIRTFSKKRMLNFDVRNITKSNLEKRDYQYLARNSGDDSMNESKLYGTSKLSYQDVDNARIVIKHTEGVNPEVPTGRTRNIGTIYIESPEGERFKYPFKHLAGARAMARHVAEGGTTYDDFGHHIVELSEELSKLRKFKNYMGRSKVMAESLSEYMDVFNNRITTVKKRIEGLQKPNYYKEAFEGFEKPVFEDIPEDVKENWIDQLTVKQFNEELKDVFPYIYKLIGEAGLAKELGPEDFVNEDDDPCWKGYKQVGMKKKGGKEVPNCVPESDCDDDDDKVEEGSFGNKIAKKFNKAMTMSNNSPEEMKKRVRNMSDEELKNLAKGAGEPEGGPGSARGLQMKLINQELKRRYGIKPGKDKFETQIENMFNGLMGQWNEDEACCDGCASGGECEKVDEIGRDDLVKQTQEKVSKNKAIQDLETKYREHLKDFKGQETELGSAIRRLKDVIGDYSKMWASGADQETLRTLKDRATELKQEIKDQISNIKKRATEDEGAEGEQQTPLSEFILSFYDRTNGSFPKGETAVLTMVEKDYGEQYIEPAKQFIERVNQTFEQYGGGRPQVDLNLAEEGGDTLHGWIHPDKGPNDWPGVAVSVYIPHPSALRGFTSNTVEFWGSEDGMKNGKPGMNGMTLEEVKSKNLVIHGSEKEALQASREEHGEEGGAGTDSADEYIRLKQLAGI